MLREIFGAIVSTKQLEIKEIPVDTTTIVRLDPITGSMVSSAGAVSINSLTNAVTLLPGQMYIADSGGVLNPQSITGDGRLIRVSQDEVTQNVVITSGNQVVEGNATTLYGQQHVDGIDEPGGVLNLQAGASSGVGLSFVNIVLPDTSVESGSVTNASSKKIIIPAKIKGVASVNGFTNILFSVLLPMNSFASFQVFANVQLVGVNALAVWCSQILVTAVRSENSADQFSFKGDTKASSVSDGFLFESVPQLSFDLVTEMLTFSISLSSDIVANPLFDLIIYNHSRSDLIF